MDGELTEQALRGVSLGDVFVELLGLVTISHITL
jgi:hypothetical protein